MLQYKLRAYVMRCIVFYDHSKIGFSIKFIAVSCNFTPMIGKHSSPTVIRCLHVYTPKQLLPTAQIRVFTIPTRTIDLSEIKISIYIYPIGEYKGIIPMSHSKTVQLLRRKGLTNTRINTFALIIILNS